MAPRSYEHTSITFEVYPKIVLKNQKTSVRISPLFVRPLIENHRYKIVAAPMEYDTFDRSKRQTQYVTCINNSVTCEFTYETEQEYRLLLFSEDDDFKDTIGIFHIFCLEEDLFLRRPFKGDFHLHSYYSDGRNSPGFIAASCRKKGLDFMAITDHREYAPSVEAQQAFKDYDIDLKIFRGEEIHPPKTETHMIGFGAYESVKRYFADEERYIELINNKKASLADELRDLDCEMEKYEYASCLYCIEKVREDGGICTFAHPYWATGNRYNISTPLTEKILKSGCFDAYELFNGDNMDINTIQLALYHDLYKQYNIPLVSGTDAHGIIDNHYFGTFHTIVYAEDCEFHNIKQNIKELNSVVVKPQKDNPPLVFGNLRLIKFTMYLLREILPIHDEMCGMEGILMEHALRGGKKAQAALSMVKGQTSDFYKKVYGTK